MGMLDRGATLTIADGAKMRKNCGPRIKKSYLAGAAALLVFIAIVLAVYFTNSKPQTASGPLFPPNPTIPLRPSISAFHKFSKAAVCADGPPCAEIGHKILEKNGSAVDAAIAALFCNGLVNMQSMGIGGGFLMTIYSREERKAYTLNARETAPQKATSDMFGNDKNKSTKGPLAIGVPGELKGYWAAHRRFGRLPWKDIIQPTIDMCEKGYPIGIPLRMHLVNNIDMVSSTLKQWFLDDDGKVKKMGDTIRPLKLCETLKVIAEKGAEDFYNGSIAENILKDLKYQGSIITKEDLENYEVKWTTAINVTLNNGDTLHSVPPPGSGVLLSFILKILDGYNFSPESIDGINNTVLTYHRIAEAFKYAYARRTELGDQDYVNLTSLINDLTSTEYADDIRMRINDSTTYQTPQHYGAVFYDSTGDNGTAHISVLAENGDAVSVTSTINLYFGSKIMSDSTGITFNSVMDDFSSKGFVNFFGLPGSPNNQIEPGKRPLSSMAPSILVDPEYNVKFVVGAAGGTQITTGISQVLMRVLWFGQNVKEAVDAPRLHHQLYPMVVYYEYGTLQQIVDGLIALGHNATRPASTSVVCALYQKNETIFANADHRKGGEVYGY